MKVIYNLKDRKPFVKAIEEITGTKAVYQKTPTYAYKVDYFTITRDGNLEFDDMTDSEEIENLLEQLADRGFVADTKEEQKRCHKAKMWPLQWQCQESILREMYWTI